MLHRVRLQRGKLGVLRKEIEYSEKIKIKYFISHMTALDDRHGEGGVYVYLILLLLE
jgi:hypothetical protein